MYTSGSTGRPKGVSIVHRGVVRLVKETNYANFSANEVFLQLASIAFDAATWEIWGSLLNGARLVIFPSSITSLEELGQVIQRYQITTLWLTAGLFHLMVNEQLEALQSLRQLLAGGDVLSVPHVQKFFKKLPNFTLINGYGPTENTTFSCCFPITAKTKIGNSVPIGRPIANTKTYILDRYLQLLPIGVAGELYLGGDGLAREYFNRPELTSERFIFNPFVEGERLYKTGDLARYLPDGNIDFLGRLDNQVKIRGFRIELGDIETAISQYPLVKETIVIAIENIAGNKQLVAYIIPQPKTAPNISDLRHFLKQKLPDYMIPSAFVTLDNLPLTPNGKVDRKSLPAPDINSLIQKADFIAPQTHTEELVASIWAKVLGVAQVGINDNFFELGGHSLLATQLLSQVNDSCGVELPLSKLFEAPTVASLANYIEAISWANKSLETSTIKANEREEVEF